MFVKVRCTEATPSSRTFSLQPAGIRRTSPRCNEEQEENLVTPFPKHFHPMIGGTFWSALICLSCLVILAAVEEEPIHICKNRSMKNLKLIEYQSNLPLTIVSEMFEAKQV